MPRNEFDAKKRHHYVWANYLTRWGSGTRNVFYTTKTGRIAHDSVRGIVVEDFFYKITPLNHKQIEVIKGYSQLSPDHLQRHHVSYLNDFLKMQHDEAVYRKSGIRIQEVEQHLHALKCNLLENLHASHESKAGPVLAALADEQLDVLLDKTHMIEFMAFFGHQISRTKTFRDSVIQALPRRNATEIDMVEAMAHAWWFLSYMFGMNIGYDLYVGRNYAKHALLINDTRVPFITSDQPVVNVHSCVSETEFAAPEYSDLYYAISPRVAYIICDSDRFARGRNVVDEVTVVELNTKVAAQAKTHIIGDSENAILPFQKYIGRRYQKAHPDLAHKQLPQ